MCRRCIKQLPSDVRDGDKRLSGQEALRGAAEAADRVSSRAGLVNLDIINTPLTASSFLFFCFTSRESRRDRARNTHVDVQQRANDTEVEAMQRLNLHGKGISGFSSKM